MVASWLRFIWKVTTGCSDVYHSNARNRQLKCKNRKTKSRKQICSEVTVNILGNPCSESWRKRKGCGRRDLQKRKVLSLE